MGNKLRRSRVMQQDNDLSDYRMTLETQNSALGVAQLKSRPQETYSHTS